MRFHKDSELPQKRELNQDALQKQPDWKKRQTGVLRRALSAMQDAQANDGRTFGKLLGDSVTSSIQTLMVIGGYIMIFSVMVKVVSLTKAGFLIQQLIGFTLVPLGFLEELSPYVVSGLFEVHLGTYSVSQAASVPLIQQAAATGAVLAFSGISVHAQVRSMIQSTDLRYIPFLVSRLLHAVLAFFMTFCLWNPLNLLFSEGKPSFLRLDAASSAASPDRLETWTSWLRLSQLFTTMLLALLFMLGISILLTFLHKHVRRH